MRILDLSYRYMQIYSIGFHLPDLLSMHRGVLFASGLVLLAAFPEAARAESVFATVVKVDGAVTFTQVDSGLARLLPSGAHILGGSVISTGTDGVSALQLTPCSAIELTPSTDLRLDDLKLVRRGDGVMVRSAEMTLSSGYANFIIEGLNTRINLPGVLLTAKYAALRIGITADGEVMATLFAGTATLTDSQGRVTELRDGTFAITRSGSVGAREEVKGNTGAEMASSAVVGFLDRAYFLNMVCEDTIMRMRGEYLRLPERLAREEEDREKRNRESSRRRTVVSPEQ
jgi:hypothetical protein